MKSSSSIRVGGKGGIIGGSHLRGTVRFFIVRPGFFFTIVPCIIVKVLTLIIIGLIGVTLFQPTVILLIESMFPLFIVLVGLLVIVVGHIGTVVLPGVRLDSEAAVPLNSPSSALVILSEDQVERFNHLILLHGRCLQGDELSLLS